MNTMENSEQAGSRRLERLWLLAKIEFKLRYYENRLGLFWALLKPVLDMAIYYVAFKIVLRSEVPHFASYLFIGLVIWNFFVESTTGTIQILQTKKYLYQYSNMNKIEIYLSVLCANSIGFFFNLLMFFLFFNFADTRLDGVSITNLWIIPLFVSLFLLSLGTSLILSSVYILAKDIHQLWTVFTSFLFFLSPIFYKLSSFKSALPGFDYLNPLAGIIINARRTMMEKLAPDWSLLFADAAIALIIAGTGLFLLQRLGAKAAEKL